MDDMLDLSSDFLDDIDIDIRSEITKELETAADKELDDIDLRATLQERAKTPEEIYATQVLKEERAFREERKKLTRYVDENGTAYYGKSYYTIWGELLSLFWLLAVGFTYILGYDMVDNVLCAISFGVAPLPALLCKIIDNILIVHEHNKREDSRFKQLNQLRKELGLPEMMDRSLKLNGKKRPCGIMIIVWTVMSLGMLKVFLHTDMTKQFLYCLTILLGYFVILGIYQLIWQNRRKNAVDDSEDDMEATAECIQKYKIMGFDGKIKTRGVFKIKFDDITTELTSDNVARAINVGDKCKYYSVQGLYGSAIKYYFGVRPPRWDMVTANLMRFVSVMFLITLGLGVLLKYTMDLLRILILAAILTVIIVLIVKCTQNAIKFIVSALLVILVAYLVLNNTDLITNLIGVFENGIEF